jgi:multiple sugar transport system permease protein
MLIAETGLRDFRMGSAAAMSYVLALALLVVSAFNFRLLRQEDT